MTSRVVVHAHCASNKEVVVEVVDTNTTDGSEIIKESFTLQDGTGAERVFYDDLVVRVREVKKAQ